MKRFFVGLLVAALVLVAFCASASAQIRMSDFVKTQIASAEQFEKMTFFPNVDACKAGFQSGDFRYYLPHPQSLKTPPVAAKGLPAPGCAHEIVRESKAGSPMWVVLAAGTPATLNDAGVPFMDGRCWNAILEFVYLELPRGAAGATGAKGDKGEPGATGAKGDKGDPGRDGINGCDAGMYHRYDVGTSTDVCVPIAKEPKSHHWLTKKKALILSGLGGAAIGVGVYGANHCWFVRR